MGTLLLEQILSKDEILAWYINLAEFGDGVFGLREAAGHYFQTKPELLTIQQGAHLALVLPSPNAWSKGLRHRRLTSFGHRRYAAIISLMRAGGFITDTLRDTAMITGDFGRPIKGWEAIQEQVTAETYAKKKLDEIAADEDIESFDTNLSEGDPLPTISRTPTVFPSSDSSSNEPLPPADSADSESSEPTASELPQPTESQ